MRNKSIDSRVIVILVLNICVILINIGLILGAQNPTPPTGITNCNSAIWNIGSPDGSTCKGTTNSLGTTNYPAVTGFEEQARLRPDLLTVNTFCKQYTHEANSYATSASVHRYCNGLNLLSFWENNKWNRTDNNLPGVLNVEGMLFCANNCCVPLTNTNCSNLGYECGDWADGCTTGNTFNCGSCSSGDICSSGKCIQNTSALPDCPENQTILRLYNYNNSHAAVYSDTNYEIKICYDDFFSNQYSLENPHNCNGGNEVLRLYSINNSHAAAKGTIVFTVPVCYGRLYCNIKSSVTECDSFGGKILMSLYDINNSHVSYGNDVNYPLKVCCKSSLTVVNNNFFGNMNNKPINKADLNDSVKLAIAGSGLIDKNINFEIRKEGSGSIIKTINVKGQKDEIAYAIWKTDSPGELYYFIATIDGTGTFDSRTNANYGYLNVTNVINNAIPTVEIISPIKGLKSKSGTLLNFNAKITDEDSDLQASWDYGDGNHIDISNCLTLNNCNTTHTYSNSGTMSFNIIVKEMDSRGYEAGDYSYLFSYKEGLNIFPVITTPENGLVTNKSLIHFNAKDSYVANCTTNVCFIGCYKVADLNCTDLDKSSAKIPFEYDLTFNWSFSEGVGAIGNYSTNKDTVVEFNRYFVRANQQYAKLKLGYKPINQQIIWSPETTNYFKIFGNYPTCVCNNQQTRCYWVSYDPVTGRENKTDSTNNCYQMNVKEGSSQDCCPLSMGSCNYNEGPDQFKCTGPPQAEECGDYTNEDDCENSDNPQIAINEVERSTESGYCNSYEIDPDNHRCHYTIGNCRCTWNSSATGDEKCFATFSKYNKQCSDSPPTDEPVSIGNCTFLAPQTIDMCETESYMIYKWSAAWSGDALEKPNECRGGERQVPCEASAQLPFFNIFNFVVTLIIISMIYLVKIFYQLRK